MRLGGPLFESFASPRQWVRALAASGYAAAYCPVSLDADESTIEAYARAARQEGVVIAEVGAWSNVLDPDERRRREALERCRRALTVAEALEARCCVNIAGSRGKHWCGPHDKDLTEETFAMIVDTVRGVIDAVKPARTFYTLETMPWLFPHSTESYRRLIDAVDRPAFAVHFDPVNLLWGPDRVFHNADIMKDFVAALGPLIRSVHIKDVILGNEWLCRIDEVEPGKGVLDYPALFSALKNLDPDLPLMLEHLPDHDACGRAAAVVRQTAERERVPFIEAQRRPGRSHAVS